MNAPMRRPFLLLLALLALLATRAQTPAAVDRLLAQPEMRGATFALLVRDLRTGRAVAAYDTLRQVTPASVLKLLTTATALELLGEDYRFETALEYDGEIQADGTLAGNLYIRGGGDPSLGSEHIADPDFLTPWLAAIRQAGIRRIEGAVIADERFFDSEGISPKWLHEDMGSYYGAGSYGLSAYDNLYRLTLRSYAAGTRPDILQTRPAQAGLRFHNHLVAQNRASDSTLILGAPFAADRYLYGVVPANRRQVTLKGDIPDPALFLATHLTEALQAHDIPVGGQPSCYRLLKEAKRWPTAPRTLLTTTYSPPLAELARITNHASHNLFADALLKTLGRRYPLRPAERINAFDRGVSIIRQYWETRSLDLSTLWMNDGSGLAPTDKVSASFLVDLLAYMASPSAKAGEAFQRSLPVAGESGSVRNFLKGTRLEGKAHLKSGSMSRTRAYAGYVDYGGHRYAVALFANQHGFTGARVNQALARLLLALFP